MAALEEAERQPEQMAHDVAAELVGEGLAEGQHHPGRAAPGSRR